MHKKNYETEDPDDMQEAEDDKEVEETDEPDKSNPKFGELFGKKKTCFESIFWYSAELIINFTSNRTTLKPFERNCFITIRCF